MKIKFTKSSIMSMIIITFISLILIQSLGSVNHSTNLEKGRNLTSPLQYLDSNPSPSLTENASVPFQVSGSSNTAEGPAIAVDSKDNVHIVWAGNVSTSNTYDIMYREFSYESQTWGSVIDLSNAAGDQVNPAIAVDQNQDIWVVWIDQSTIGNDICGRFFNSTSNQWNPTNTIVSGSVASYNYYPAIANSTNGNFTFTLVYTSQASTSTCSINYGFYSPFNTSWYISPNPASSGGTTPAHADIYYDKDNNGYLVFSQGSGASSIIYLCNQINDTFGGNNLADITSLCGSDTYDASYPSVIADPAAGRIYVAWQDKGSSSGNYQIRFVNLTQTDIIDQNYPTNYPAPVENITSSTVNQIYPTLAFGYNGTEVTPAILWINTTTNPSYPQLMLQRSLYQSSETFNQNPGNFIISNIDQSVLVNDGHNSLFAVYAGKDSSSAVKQIWFREYDVWGPQLNFVTPANNSIVKGNVPLNVTTEPDTRTVTYKYYEDTNGNGKADDGNSWNTIATLNYPTDFNTTWDTTQNGLKDYRNILISAKAVDVNGLNQTIIKSHITIDNNPPQLVKFSNITDSESHYANNIYNGNPAYFGGVVSFNFQAYDNCSGINHVELWNGNTNTLLGSNNTSGNDTSITLDTSNASFDGSYSDLFIKAYDNAGNVNQSSIFLRTITIDNVKPTPSFIGLTENQEYSRTIGLNVSTSQSDTSWVKYYYYPTSNPNNETLIGMVNSASNGIYTYNWDTSKLNGNYTVLAQVSDKVSLQTNITINIQIDNTPPSPIIITPSELQTVGTYVNVTVQSDLDTIKVVFYNCSTEYGTYERFATVLANSSKVIGNYRYFTAFFDSYLLASNSIHFLKVNATDNQNFINGTQPREIQITDKYPITVVSKLSSKYSYNSTSETYSIQLNWESPLNEWNITHYYIYRIAENPSIFDIQLINGMTPQEKFNYLGNQVGQKYCVAIDSVSQITDQQPHNYTWTDTGLYSSTYYYLIIAVNVYGNPSNSSTLLTVNIPPENPQKQVNLTDIQNIPIIFGVWTGLVALLTVIFVKSSKSKKRQKETRETLEEMYEEKFTDTGEKTLEERLDEMESIAEIQMQESSKNTDVKGSDSVKPKSKEDNFLEMKIATDAEEGSSEKGTGPRRCPYCNWMISSTATKCPRCGKTL